MHTPQWTHDSLSIWIGCISKQFEIIQNINLTKIMCSVNAFSYSLPELSMSLTTLRPYADSIFLDEFIGKQIVRYIHARELYW